MTGTTASRCVPAGARGVSQEDFATDAGFDRGYISGVERGVRNPSADVLERIAKALGVDVAELFDRAKAAEFAKASRQQLTAQPFS